MLKKTEQGLYSCEQIREIEHYAINTLQIDAYTLMERAGAGAYEVVKKKFPSVNHVAIFCGSGNNAGDGYILARLLKGAGKMVTVFAVKPPESLPKPASLAANLALDAGVFYQEIDEALDVSVDLIVDALLGIGIQGAPKDLMVAAILQMNDSGLPILALDIPSGLQADTGFAAGDCVKADVTVTFIAPKIGLYLLDGKDYCGDIFCSDLKLSSVLKNMSPAAFLLEEDPTLLPPRKKNSHKGNFGHVLIIGSGLGMPGAVGLAAKACMRTGAGLVTIATDIEHVDALVPMIPEVLFSGIENSEDLQPLLERATVCIIGPGLGDSPWAEALFQKAMTSNLPMVIDASALRFLAADSQHDDNWVLTPHPGEAADLLGISTKTVQHNRYETIESLQEQYGGVIVLKGCGTLIKTLDGVVYLCDRGNPGMATAGMGDVLSGIIGGLIAQGCDLSYAARLGVWLHATVADRIASRCGERGLLASDIADSLPAILNSKRL